MICVNNYTAVQCLYVSMCNRLFKSNWSKLHLAELKLRRQCFILAAVFRKETKHSKPWLECIQIYSFVDLVPRCNMDCGPNGYSKTGSCRCEKGYSECPFGYRGDDCTVPISACSFTNRTTTPVSICDGNQAVTCVQRTAVNTTTCEEGCLNGKCLCTRQNRCSGHGSCLDGVCQCDVGWGGQNCSEILVRHCLLEGNSWRALQLMMFALIFINF